MLNNKRTQSVLLFFCIKVNNLWTFINILLKKIKKEFWQKKRIYLRVVTNVLLDVNDYTMKGEIVMEVLKVSTKSNPNSVAGALAAVIKDKNVVEIQAVGAGAINQAIKAIAIARGFVAPTGKDIVCVPAFTDIEINGEERTAIKLIVQPR